MALIPFRIIKQHVEWSIKGEKEILSDKLVNWLTNNEIEYKILYNGIREIEYIDINDSHYCLIKLVWL